MIELFFVETADYLRLPDLDALLATMGLKKESVLVGDFLKVVLSENQIDLSNIDNKIILDQAGRIVTPDTVLEELLAIKGDEDHSVGLAHPDHVRSGQQLLVRGRPELREPGLEEA